MKTHKHLVLTGVSATPTRDPEFIKQYLLDLVEQADMEVFMEPQAKYCDDPNNAGVTGTVVITTSHSSVHIWDKTGLVQVDLYSCKDFDVAKIVDFIRLRLKLSNWNHQVIDRAPFDWMLRQVSLETQEA